MIPTVGAVIYKKYNCDDNFATTCGTGWKAKATSKAYPIHFCTADVCPKKECCNSYSRNHVKSAVSRIKRRKLSDSTQTQQRIKKITRNTAGKTATEAPTASLTPAIIALIIVSTILFTLVIIGIIYCACFRIPPEEGRRISKEQQLYSPRGEAHHSIRNSNSNFAPVDVSMQKRAPKSKPSYTEKNFGNQTPYGKEDSFEGPQKPQESVISVPHYNTPEGQFDSEKNYIDVQPGSMPNRPEFGEGKADPASGTTRPTREAYRPPSIASTALPFGPAKTV